MNKPRGGVAAYQKVLSDDFPDSIAVKVKNTNIVLIAVYIPPSDSKYFNINYFDSLDLYCSTFSRIRYIQNPVRVINQHGRKLLNIMKTHYS